MPQLFNRKNRILLRELIKTDFKLRYQGSALGYLWALLRPLLMFAVLYIVFGHFLKFGDAIPHYPVYLLLGTTMWSFFTECTNQGIQAIITRGDLIRKISFPKYIVTISATGTALINLAINLVVVIFFALLNGVTPSWTWLLVFPLVLELYLFSLGLSFFLGAINVKYRDISSIWVLLRPDYLPHHYDHRCLSLRRQDYHARPYRPSYSGSPLLPYYEGNCHHVVYGR